MTVVRTYKHRCLRCYLPNFINNSSPKLLYLQLSPLNLSCIDIKVLFCLMLLFHCYPLYELLRSLDYLYPMFIFHVTDIFCVSPCDFPSSVFFQLSILFKFANYVVCACFGVRFPDTIIVCCMHNSTYKPVQTTKKFMEILTFASAIACRFCFITHRWSEFEVSCNKLLVPRLCIHRQIWCK